MAKIPIKQILIAVLTVSDRCSRGEAEDLSGPLAAHLAAEMGATVSPVRVVPDEPADIATALLQLSEQHDVVITTGGTGFTPRDRTPEATRTVLQREAPGIAELLRHVGMEKSPFAGLSRGVAGICGQALIVNLPGSPKAVEESMAALLGLVPHVVAMLRGEGAHH